MTGHSKGPSGQQVVIRPGGRRTTQQCNVCTHNVRQGIRDGIVRTHELKEGREQVLVPGKSHVELGQRRAPLPHLTGDRVSGVERGRLQEDQGTHKFGASSGHRQRDDGPARVSDDVSRFVELGEQCRRIPDVALLALDVRTRARLVAPTVRDKEPPAVRSVRAAATRWVGLPAAPREGAEPGAPVPHDTSLSRPAGSALGQSAGDGGRAGQRRAHPARALVATGHAIRTTPLVQYTLIAWRQSRRPRRTPDWRTVATVRERRRSRVTDASSRIACHRSRSISHQQRSSTAALP